MSETQQKAPAKKLNRRQRKKRVQGAKQKQPLQTKTTQKQLIKPTVQPIETPKNPELEFIRAHLRKTQYLRHGPNYKTEFDDDDDGSNGPNGPDYSSDSDTNFDVFDDGMRFDEDGNYCSYQNDRCSP